MQVVTSPGQVAHATAQQVNAIATVMDSNTVTLSEMLPIWTLPSRLYLSPQVMLVCMHAYR